MWVIGDVHGKISQYRSIIRQLPMGAKSLQLGDMGIGFKGVHLFPKGSMCNGVHRFLRGNHDDPARCRRHPLYKGDWGYDPDEHLFYLGGAWSIDKDWRVEGESWWRDEELDYRALDEAYQLYVKVKPRIVATHEAPSRAAWSMLAAATGNVAHHDFCPTDQSVAVKGDEYAYYKAKLGCVNTRTSQALQRMFEEHQPEYWLFGHYHMTRDFTIGRTKFTCLNELDVREIVLEDLNKSTLEAV